MSGAPPFHVCRHTRASQAPPAKAPFILRPILVAPPESPSTLGPAKRRKIWEFAANLHCSIIGTCLSTAELRQVLGKLSLAASGATDHDLHGTAVTLASQHVAATKMLHKALDLRHRVVINQFDKGATEADVRMLWREAVSRGDIPGAYWATLTHPATTGALIREAFGEVHMLSHLVGAANRADIRRLRELERQQADLEARLARQQVAFRDAIVARDTHIGQLQQAVAERIHTDRETQAHSPDDARTVFQNLFADMERRLSAETARRTGAEERLSKTRDALGREREARRACERDNRALTGELAALEASLAPPINTPAGAPARLDGLTLLYVGARANQTAHLRGAAEQRGAAFLHHDGGREQHPDLLAGLLSRANIVLFPVDCISHDAALTVKRLCRQVGKPFVALRSASMASFIAVLHRMDIADAIADAAD